MKTFVLTAALAAALTGSALAAPAKRAAPLVCPITGEKIASVKDAAGHSTYHGKTYYFCCARCKPQFDDNPAKYVHPAAKK